MTELMEKNDLTLNEAQKLVDNWIQTVGVRYFNELTNMTLLMEEAIGFRLWAYATSMN